MMSLCRLTWDSYKSNICNGFTLLQQSDQFVDMTLAAEGHYVKVHKSLLALASPYIRELIQSAPCPHPIIFLNSMSHETLCLIVEYVYSGEVQVPLEKMSNFIQAAKALHIIGVNSLDPPSMDACKAFNTKKLRTKNKSHTINRHINEDCTTSSQRRIDEEIADNLQNYSDNEAVNETWQHTAMSNNLNEPVQPDTQNHNSQDVTSEQVGKQNNTFDAENYNKVDNIAPSNLEYPFDFEELISYNKTSTDTDTKNTKEQNTMFCHNNPTISQEPNAFNIEIKENFLETDNNIDSNMEKGCEMNNEYKDRCPEDSAQTNSKNYTLALKVIDGDLKCQQNSIKKSSISNLPASNSERINSAFGTTALFMSTNRGSFQMILNRYMYYNHHSSQDGNRRRWRCIDYRHKGCKAYIDTYGDKIITRKFIHPHSFHDEIIVKKGRSKNVCSTIKELLAHLKEEEQSKNYDDESEELTI